MTMSSFEPLPASTAAAVSQARAATASPREMPSRSGHVERLSRGVGAADRVGKLFGAAALPRHVGERGQIDAAARGVKIEQTLRELGHLGDTAGDGDARNGMVAKIFQHAADEIAHVDQRAVGKTIQRLHRGLGGSPRGAGDMANPGGAGHVDALMDRGDPGRAGIGHDDAGGAEDRQAAENAEPRVQRLRRQLFAAGDRDFDLDIACRAGAARATSAIASRIIWRGTGLMAGSPGGTGRPGKVTVPTPGPALKLTPLPRAAFAHRGEHKRAMRHVRIVAGVLDHAGARHAVLQAMHRQAEGDTRCRREARSRRDRGTRR